ncbi:MAG: DUF4974 domain-containing protein [Bacteroides sp.]|nr:DUF4974 domain-containing protein [Bacteroides sp.]
MKDYVQKLINEFTSSKYSEEVSNEMYQWLLNEEHSDEKEMALQSLWSQCYTKFDVTTWDSLREIYGKIEHDKEPRKIPHRLFRKYMVAASVLLLLSVTFTYFFTGFSLRPEAVSMVERYVPDGKIQEIALPDSSRVMVNSGTLLLYPKAFEGDVRVVYLVGEADFHVKEDPDKPFIVRSAGTSVTALGTEFNVSAYPEEANIVATLIHGRVKVDCEQTGASYLLTPGQQVIYDRETFSSVVKEADLNNVTAWQRGHIVFRGCTMGEIFRVLERRFDVTFQYNTNNFMDDKYNFGFTNDTSIEEIMEVICEVNGKFTYRMDGNVYYIKFYK